MEDTLPAPADEEDGLGLSLRERQLLQLATRGCIDQSIADQLGISLATVGTYWGRIRIKLGPHNRTELVAKFLQSRAERTVARLRDENDALIRQIEGHAKTMEMLRTSLEIFQGLVEIAPDAILLVDEAGSIQFSNAQASELFGYLPEELVGMPVEGLVPERYRGLHLMHRADYNENPVKRRMGAHLATMALCKDGREFPMATALSATKTPKGLIVTCIVRDLSEGF